MLDTTIKSVTKIQRQKQRYILGIGVKKEERSSQTMQERCSKIHQKENSRAEIVELLLKLNILQSFIVKVVSILKDYIKPFVLFVEKYFLKKEMVAGLLKPVRIVAVGNYEKEKVYKLTIEDAHLYYANGVLVTNTDSEDHAYDSIRYGMMSRRIKSKSTTPLDPVQKKFEEWKQKDRDFAKKTNKYYRSI